MRKIDGVIDNPSSYALPTTYAHISNMTYNVCPYYEYSSNKVVVTHGISRAGFTAYITLQYTKTTD